MKFNLNDLISKLMTYMDPAEEIQEMETIQLLSIAEDLAIDNEKRKMEEWLSSKGV